MKLTKDEEVALKGEKGETLEPAYRILVATGEATDAERLVPIEYLRKKIKEDNCVLVVHSYSPGYC